MTKKETSMTNKTISMTNKTTLMINKETSMTNKGKKSMTKKEKFMTSEKNATQTAAQTAKTQTATAQAVKNGAVTVYDELPNLQLTEHFNLREFIISSTAIYFALNNMPSDDGIDRIKALCVNVLEPLRRRFGVIRITSGYRSEVLNKLVHGAVNSQHLLGEAADISVGNREVGLKMYEFIRKNLDFDQLILEHDRKRGTYWMHVSYRRDGNNRHMALEMTV